MASSDVFGCYVHRPNKSGVVSPVIFVLYRLFVPTYFLSLHCLVYADVLCYRFTIQFPSLPPSQGDPSCGASMATYAMVWSVHVRGATDIAFTIQPALRSWTSSHHQLVTALTPSCHEFRPTSTSPHRHSVDLISPPRSYPSDYLFCIN